MHRLRVGCHGNRGCGDIGSNPIDSVVENRNNGRVSEQSSKL
jgi:hypothetical protein